MSRPVVRQLDLGRSRALSWPLDETNNEGSALIAQAQDSPRGLPSPPVEEPNELDLNTVCSDSSDNSDGNPYVPLPQIDVGCVCARQPDNVLYEAAQPELYNPQANRVSRRMTTLIAQMQPLYIAWRKIGAVSSGGRISVDNVDLLEFRCEPSGTLTGVKRWMWGDNRRQMIDLIRRLVERTKQWWRCVCDELLKHNMTDMFVFKRFAESLLKDGITGMANLSVTYSRDTTIPAELDAHKLSVLDICNEIDVMFKQRLTALRVNVHDRT